MQKGITFYPLKLMKKSSILQEKYIKLI